MTFLPGWKDGKMSLRKFILLVIVLSVGSTEVFYCVHGNDMLISEISNSSTVLNMRTDVQLSSHSRLKIPKELQTAFSMLLPTLNSN